MIKNTFSLEESVINDAQKELAKIGSKELIGCENILNPSCYH